MVAFMRTTNNRLSGPVSISCLVREMKMLFHGASDLAMISNKLILHSLFLGLMMSRHVLQRQPQVNGQPASLFRHTIRDTRGPACRIIGHVKGTRRVTQHETSGLTSETGDELLR